MKTSKPIILSLFISFINAKVFASENFKSLFPKELSITKGIFSELTEGEIYSDASISSKDSQQKLNLFVAGIHPLKCSRAFPKLALLTNYKNYLSSFIKESTYDYKENSFTLILDHLVLPYPMRVKVYVEYPRQIKDYPFHMKGGLFPGLSGVIYTRQYKKRCLFYLTTKWEGKKVFKDPLLELMSETLTKLGLSLIFRKTKN